MPILESLFQLLRETTEAMSLRRHVAWTAVLARLEDLRLQALADPDDPQGPVTATVSVINILIDCVRDVVTRDQVAEAAKALGSAREWTKGFSRLGRKGAEIEVLDDVPTGYSAMRWRLFLACFGPELNANNKRDQERLWQDLHASPYELPMLRITLAERSGALSTWVTDDGVKGLTLPTSNPTSDVYDALGLDWTGQAERIESGVHETRALLYGCKLRTRKGAAGALHAPTAVDGWGNMFFVSRSNTGKDWPDHGSATARPDDDKPSLAEAIHGPAETETTNVAFTPLGFVRIGHRAKDYGENASARALARLRAALRDHGESV